MRVAAQEPEKAVEEAKAPEVVVKPTEPEVKKEEPKEEEKVVESSP